MVKLLKADYYHAPIAGMGRKPNLFVNYVEHKVSFMFSIKKFDEFENNNLLNSDQAYCLPLRIAVIPSAGTVWFIVLRKR